MRQGFDGLVFHGVMISGSSVALRDSLSEDCLRGAAIQLGGVSRGRKTSSGNIFFIFWDIIHTFTIAAEPPSKKLKRHGFGQDRKHSRHEVLAAIPLGVAMAQAEMGQPPTRFLKPLSKLSVGEVSMQAGEPLHRA